MSTDGLSAALRPRDLRCEHLDAPLNVGTPAPRLSWRADHPESGQGQSAWQVRVTGDPSVDGGALLWDSGKVAGSDPWTHYGGSPLAGGQQCWWTARVWDLDDRPGAWSAPARFGIGLLEPGAWEAAWIAPPAPRRGVAPLLRTAFTLERPPARAVAYLCGLGYHEFSVNGAKVGDAVLEPGFTDYTRRVLYTAHDVTDRLRAGENALGVMLGEGWLGNDHRLFRELMQRLPHWLGDPCLLLQLQLTFAGGETARICSRADGSWLCGDGPIVANNLYDGETYDARREQPGWDAPGFRPDPARPWTSAAAATPPRGRLVPQLLEPIRVTRELRPAAITRPRPGVYVVDLGQNIAGWARIAVQGPAGTAVTLRYAEILDDAGLVNQAPLRSARATDTYLLKGVGVEQYAPRFTYHGFRYVQLEGWPGVPPGPDDVTGCAVRSDVAPAGDFACSDPLLNAIHRAVQWTEAGNLHGLPTDCPQRDERLGWLNDATVRLEEAVCNYRLPALLTKWAEDIADTTTADGAILDTAPYIHGPAERADAVCSSYLLIPWLLWLHEGDRRPLERHYDGLKGWTEYLRGTTEDGIVPYSHYGDWASPAAHCLDDTSANSRETPGPLMSTGYLYYNETLLARFARLLGRDGDARDYAMRAEETRAAFLRHFYHPATHAFAGGSQASQVFPLYLGIVPEADRTAVIARAADDVVARGYHLTTGNLCTKYLLEMLTEYGHADTAFRLAAQTTYPSWGDMLAHGATTVWERWEPRTGAGMNSHNHPMFAAIGSWFYTHLAGIRLDLAAPGAARLCIRPHFPAGLRFVTATRATLRGNVVSRWTRDGDRVRVEVTVPFNTSATVILPGRPLIYAGAGTHRFDLPNIGQFRGQTTQLPGVQRGVE